MKEKSKSSWYLPDNILKAMDVVFQNKRIQKSHQVELGLILYLQEHKELLKDNGIEL